MSKPLNFKNYKKIPLFYWSERRFIFREKENYGDLLSKYLVEKISGKETRFVHPKKQAWYKTKKANLLAIGSIIHHASKDSVVWGSGIIDHEQELKKADFRAVRGPRTREYLLKLGYECTEVYGDPAILLPDHYNPKVEKRYKLGIVPHYHDYAKALEIFGGMEKVKVLDLLTMDVEATTKEILECDRILSTSLHGLIVAHAYGIPAVWIKMSSKIFGNDIKYTDYLESVGLETYKGEFIEEGFSEEKILEMFEKYPTLVSEGKLNELKTGLLEVIPF
ncbi:polysaccharide pyruvyl transferase family protein [Salinimicrobium sp. TIG7-5_MAKvit]|uniref:polysaccharide pyruvyl transferase family protein n=1 Tax=Salinimicrobium sp. TIG7-5_MAKvit TaxID=3121289 RepID=UPI003C6E7BBF